MQQATEGFRRDQQQQISSSQSTITQESESVHCSVSSESLTQVPVSGRPSNANISVLLSQQRQQIPSAPKQDSVNTSVVNVQLSSVTNEFRGITCQCPFEDYCLFDVESKQ